MRQSAVRSSIFTLIGAILAFAFLTGLSGCSARQDLTIQSDGSGSASVTVTLHPIMVSYFTDLMSAMTGADAEHPVFDLDHIRAVFAERPGTRITRLEEPERGTLRVDVSFTDVNVLLPPTGSGTPVLAFVRRAAERELRLRLDREALDRMMDLSPPGAAQLAGLLLPPTDGSVSRSEFRPEMAWALEEYGERRVVERVLDDATIDVVVRTPTPIIRQTGGRIEPGSGDRAVRFSVPVLDVLTLTGERVYSVVFSP